MKAVSASAGRGQDDPCPYSLSVARRAALRALCSSSGITSPRDVRAGFVDVRLRRCDIVVLAVLAVRDFGNAVVDQLAHGLQIAA
jgi:hypothetical protein